MFKFTDISTSQMEKIEQIRGGQPQARKYDFSLEGGESPSTEYTFPHHTYTIGLDALQKTASPKAKLTGTRVIEAGQDKFNYIYDLNDTAGGAEPHMFKDRQFLKGYENAFNNIIGSPMEKQGYEVRTLKIPALHVEALWLHKDTAPTRDKYVPVRPSRSFEANQVYSANVFFSILTKMAKKYNVDDELLGG